MERRLGCPASHGEQEVVEYRLCPQRYQQLYTCISQPQLRTIQEDTIGEGSEGQHQRFIRNLHRKFIPRADMDNVIDLLERT